MHNYNQLKADLGKIMDKLSISAHVDVYQSWSHDHWHNVMSHDFIAISDWLTDTSHLKSL